MNFESLASHSNHERVGVILQDIKLKYVSPLRTPNLDIRVLGNINLNSKAPTLEEFTREEFHIERYCICIKMFLIKDALKEHRLINYDI